MHPENCWWKTQSEYTQLSVNGKTRNTVHKVSKQQIRVHKTTRKRLIGKLQRHSLLGPVQCLWPRGRSIDTESVGETQTPSTGLPSTSFLEEDAGNRCRLGVWSKPKLQVLVYDILPSTTAVFSYAIGSRKLSGDEQFFFFFFVFCCCSNSSRFVTNNSNKSRRIIYSRQQSLHQHKWNHNRLNRDGTLFFTRDGCVSCLRACFGTRLLLQSY